MVSHSGVSPFPGLGLLNKECVSLLRTVAALSSVHVPVLPWAGS